MREDVVIRYLFDGLSSRKLDSQVLGLDSAKSKGYQSWAILRRYGLGDDFKGIFKGMSLDEALEELNKDSQYDVIYEIVSGAVESFDIESDQWAVGLTKNSLVKTRVNQNKFRELVLNAYGGSYCITGINEPRLLRASHIKPWSKSNGREKLDVRNGLCLNALHDAAFDAGLITVDPSGYCVRLSSSIEDSMDEHVYESYFRKYDGEEISIPKKGADPNPDYLEYHRRNIFGKGRNHLWLEIELLS